MNGNPCKHVIQVKLVRFCPLSSADGYGFNVKGGRDKPFREGDPSIYITRLRPGAAAEKDGRLSPGDKIVEVCIMWLYTSVQFTSGILKRLVTLKLSYEASVSCFYVRRRSHAQEAFFAFWLHEGWAPSFPNLVFSRSKFRVAMFFLPFLCAENPSEMLSGTQHGWKRKLITS